MNYETLEQFAIARRTSKGHFRESFDDQFLSPTELLLLYYGFGRNLHFAFQLGLSHRVRAELVRVSDSSPTT